MKTTTIRTMSIDIETYSGISLAKSGVYKYAESPDFEILLFGYSVNSGPVQVVDLARGEAIPVEILSALTDETVTKWAFNASFERICLSEYLRRHHPEHFRGYSIPEDTAGNYLDPAAWRCSMIWSAYMGLPLSLAGAGAVLGLEEQKLTEGKDLIRYFCIPCKPTKSNGGRTRNLPADASEKWERFKFYNQRDVEVEMAIQKRLAPYPVPDQVWDEYHLDQEINDRGILLDQDVVRNAISFDERIRAELTAAMQRITGLGNPGSVHQMRQWLLQHDVDTDSLDKKAVRNLIKSAPDQDVADALQLRQQLAKSSVKKYQAMESCACSDGRAHGMFQFYGANRSGRWAGRLIQLQNLPQNHLPDLAEARELVRNGDYDTMRLLYDDVPDTLSQLIRTAFIPRPGCKFIVSDFSAIEARVLSWLAGEDWRTEVFKNNGDIYCASASAMFGVPVEKHGINGHLRQKGKVAELACIAEGQPVLTNHGLIPIEEVTTDDLVWDGLEWVRHEGVVFRGERKVMTYEGLTATTDHFVWVEGKSRPVRFEYAAACGAHLLQTGNGEHAVRMGENHQPAKALERILESLLCADTVSGMRQCAMAASGQPAIREIGRLSALLLPKADPEMAGQAADCRKTAVRESERFGISQLRSKRNTVPVSERDRGRSVSDLGIRRAGLFNGTGQDQHGRTLRAGKSALYFQAGKYGESSDNGSIPIRSAVLAIQPDCGNQEAVRRNEPGRNHRGCGEGGRRETQMLEADLCTARLYDIRNAGRHHRYTVSNCLVHNCGYGGSVGALKAMGAAEMGLSDDELQQIVADWRKANPHIVQFWWSVDRAVKKAIKDHDNTQIKDIRFECCNGMLFITLPSGRQLSYVKPRIGENRFGGESVTYEGVGATKKWERIESYGPKFVENIVQAISRDILCCAMQTLRSCFIVGHVHDELIIECSPEVSLQAVCDQMGRTPLWAEGLMLRADGYECNFYRKD